ncbi:MAG: S8 family serine peptidase [Gemmatimonadales bacterium]|nr:S8 family serine peptidase [Gemmatimonadales bacterium]
MPIQTGSRQQISYWSHSILIMALLSCAGVNPANARSPHIPLVVDSFNSLVPDEPGSPAQALPSSRSRLLFSQEGDPQRRDLPFLDRKLDQESEKSIVPTLVLSPEQQARLDQLSDPRYLRGLKGKLSEKTAISQNQFSIQRLPVLGEGRPTPEKDLPWSPDQLLANPTNMNDEHISLAENPVTGHLFAVFAATDLGGTDRDIHIAKSTNDGTSWTTWEMPSSAYDEYHPDLAIDAAGYIHVIWIRDDGSLMRARSKSPDDPASWTNFFSFLVSEPLAIPSLAISGAGDFAKLFIAVDWQTANYDYGWYEWTLLFLHSTNGGLSLNYDYFLPDGYEDLWPTVAMDNGTVHFVNAEVDLYTGETELLIATDVYNGGFAAPAMLTGWTPNNCGFPDVVCQGDNVFLVYQHDYTDGLTTDGDIIYTYSWDAGSTFFGPIGLIADEYESVGPTVFTRNGIVGCLWLDAPPGGDEFQLASRLGSGNGHTDMMGPMEMVSETTTVEPTYHSCVGAAVGGGIQAAWIDRRDYPTQGHNVYTSRRELSSNLAAFVPAGWDNHIVASLARGDRTGNYLAADDTTFVSFAFLNDGLADISKTFQLDLSLDGTLVASWSMNGLPTGTYVPVEDFPLVISEGQHTLTVDLDTVHAISEADETDNTFGATLIWIDGDPALRLNPDRLTHTIVPATSKSMALELVDNPLLRREVYLPVIDTQLAEAMDSAGPVDLLRVMIVPAERIDPNAMGTALKDAARTTRRDVVLRAAKTQAARTWAHLQPELDRLVARGQASEVKQLWLPGLVATRMTPSAIEELALNPEVGFLWLDETKSQTFGPAPSSKTSDVDLAAADQEKAAAWHIATIRADAAWSQGITGEGVLVGHMDTGIAYDHPDLVGRMWDGGAAWPHHGYDSVSDDNDPYDGDTSYYHGTHTAGLIAGDGSSGTATGAAPGATLMALRAVPGYMEDMSEAMQFGLDNGVHIFSLSGGWAQASEAVRVANRYSAEMLLAMEVPWVCSAGNGDNYGGHYSVPIDVVSPGDSPSAWYAPNGGHTAVFAVGAVTSSLAVWDGSSYGPTSWNAENTLGSTDYHDYPYTPGLIKPDITAPGANITSCTGKSGYVSYSGTSMSCPLVTGTFCLLRSAAPGLTVSQLCETVEFTATDLTVSPATYGRDNYTGAGLVNISAALNHLPSAEVEYFWICNDGVLPLVINQIYVPAPWLEIPLPEQSIAPGDSLRLAALIDPEGMLEGVYKATAVILSNDPATVHSLPVTLIYGESATSVEDPLPLHATTSLTNHPNPFNPRTILHFSTSQPGPVRVEIFDIRGRLVRGLVDEYQSAGGHEVVWDGRDNAGQNVSSGHYLARIATAQGNPMTRKMTLLR